jgi:hypothetical protein
LRTIFVPRRHEETEGWRILHNEEHNFHSSLTVITVLTIKRLRRMGNVARRAETKNSLKILVKKPEVNDLEELGVDG